MGASATFIGRQLNTMAARVLLITLFAAIIAIGSSTQEWSEPIPEVGVAESLLQEAVQGSDNPDLNTLSHEAHGDQVAEENQEDAVTGPTDTHEPITCAEGQVACEDGSCVSDEAECPQAQSMESLKERRFRQGPANYEYTFKPDPNKLDKPPSVAGREEDYEGMAKDYENSQAAAAEEAIVHAEQSAGTAFAAHDFELDSKAQRLNAEKQEVKKDMNIAAAAAASFKKADAGHDKSVLEVQKSLAAEKAQEKVVREAELTLRAEKKRLAEAKKAVSRAEKAEEQARYNAEYEGNQYEEKKATAIHKDDVLQEEIHESDEKEHFRQVAIQAVKAAAQAELAKAKAAHKLVAPKKKIAGGKAVILKDCPEGHLPEIYVKAGGTCSDCPKWAKKGECGQKEYEKFMSHYCAASCAAVKKQHAKAAASAPAKKAPAKKAAAKKA